MSQSSERTGPRPVRSFVRRAGRITPAQQRALSELWPRYGIDYSPAALDISEAFGRTAPCWVEIGFGNGELLIENATRHPDRNYLGIEVHEPGVGHCLLALDKANLENVRLIRHDAVEVLTNRLPGDSLAGVMLMFPDPWPKKRHHKRRLVQPDFVELLARRLAAGGELHIATDWADYAAQIARIVEAGGYFARCRTVAARSKTRFERRGAQRGHRVHDFVYRRI